jgi:hypothetical protein
VEAQNSIQTLNQLFAALDGKAPAQGKP